MVRLTSRLFGVAFLLCAAGLLGVAGLTFVLSYLGTAPPRQAVVVRVPEFYLRVQVRQVLVSDQMAHLEVTAVGPTAPQLSEVTAGGRSILACQPNGCTLDPSVADRSITVTLASDPSRPVLSIPLTCLQPAAPQPCPAGDVSVPINGDVRGYPHDRYNFRAVFLLSPGDGIDIGPLVKDPAKVDANALPSAGAWKADDIAIGSLPPASPTFTRGAQPTESPTTATVNVAATLKRGTALQAYVWCLSLVPLLFALLFFHLLFVNGATRNSPIRDFLVALSATTLAVLPLRAVLVPAEITGLTRVDVLLGLGVAALVSLGLAKYGREVLEHNAPPSDGG